MLTEEKCQQLGHLLDQGDKEEALQILLPEMDKDFGDPNALFVAGLIFFKSDKVGLAYQMFRRAAELMPKNPETWANLGNCFHATQNLDEAEMCFKRSLNIRPHADVLNNLALIQLNKCMYGEVIRMCNEVIQEKPEHLDANINRAFAFLALGRWREGWKGYNLNIGVIKDRKELEYPGSRRWNGAKGENVVCYGEQGIGDEISFASCLPDLIRDSKSVTIECDRRLKGLFQRSFPTTKVHGSRYDDKRPWAAEEKFDSRVALGQLPEFYRNEDDSFPGTPYLVPDKDMVIQWRALLDSLGPKPKIGLAWSGGRAHTFKDRRSLKLVDLLPVLRHDAHWISLQYENPEDELESLEETHGIKVHHWRWGVENYDYDQTAALVSQLDLVISVTTTAVHLAGGLGVPCWCLVPDRVMWRYLTQAHGSWFPWAKSVELFRQHGEKWPIDRISQRLDERYNELQRARIQAVR